MKTQNITVPLRDGNMGAYLAVPDHAPGHKDPASGRQAFAFEFGYIKAMIQAVMDED